MTTWRPDPTFYPSPRMAMQAPAETLAYVASFDPTRRVPDAISVIDVDPGSPTYSQMVGTVTMPNAGDELHHFGWNACSSCLCPNAPHPHAERRYLIVPGLRSSRIHILDTKADPREPKIVRVLEPQEVAERSGYTRPHTIHCGPEGIYVAALANAQGEAPGGVFLMDHETFDIRGRWEIDRGPAAPRLRRMVAPRLRHHGDERVGPARDLRERPGPGSPARRPIRPQTALLGPARAQAQAGDRLRHRESTGLRTSSRARPDQGLWLRQLGHQPEGSVRVHLDLVPPGRCLGGQEDHRDPRGTRRRRTCCRRC